MRIWIAIMRHRIWFWWVKFKMRHPRLDWPICYNCRRRIWAKLFGREVGSCCGKPVHMGFSCDSVR